MALLTALSHSTGAGCEFQALFGFLPWLLHQWVSVVAAFQHARFDPAGL